MKDLGPLKYFLGIEVSRSKDEILISQIKYTLYILQETRMLGCKRVDTPMIEGLKHKNETHHVRVDNKKVSNTRGHVDVLGTRATKHCLYIKRG